MSEHTPAFFPAPADFRGWLDEHHATSEQLWVGYYRKATNNRRQAARWVTSAKREETRARRLATLIDDSGNRLRIKQLRKS